MILRITSRKKIQNSTKLDVVISMMLKKKQMVQLTRRERKKIRTATKEEREEAFEEIQGMSMVDPSILSTKAFDIIKQDFESAIAEGTTYM